jgi:molybdopterin-guanine dinucleotide biosynthesis protein A
MSEATTSPSTRRSNTIPSLHGLLVLGGQSTRMGRDKAFLDFPQSPGTSTTTSCPLYLHLLGLLHQACPAGVYISHNASQRDTLERAHQLPPRTFLVQDDARIVSADIGGPAAGLLSAHLANPETTFLVLAVDFPLVTLDTLTDLVSRYTPPVTCYLHTSDNHPEPLLSIWGPDALEELQQNAMGEKKKTGPCWTARRIWKRLGVETVGEDGKTMVDGDFVFKPREEHWLFNTNKPEEWERATSILSSGRTQ